MLQDLKKFLLRGNVVDLAVAVIIGVAFGAVVASLVDDVIMAVIGTLFGKPSFNDLTFDIGDGVVFYGRFLTAVVNFLIVAFAVFLIVRAANRLAPPATAAATTKDCPSCAMAIPLPARKCPYCTTTL
jgi:large conductance mechanosensitive channel